MYVFGPEANQHVLADGAANFTWREAFGLLEVVDGPTALVLSDGDEHRRRRRLVQRVEWELRDPEPRPTGLATFARKGGVPITVT